MFHQTPDKWEVADVYTVEPVRIYLEDDGATIVRLAPHEVVGTYTFDMALPAVRASRANDAQKTAVRPRLSSHQSTQSNTSSERSASTSSVSPPSHSLSSSSPKRTAIDSAISFLRRRTNSSQRGFLRRHESSSSSSLSDASISGSASSGVDSDAERIEIKARKGRKDAANAAGQLPCYAGDAVNESSRLGYSQSDLKRALVTARGELMKQVEVSGKNALVSEGWSLTVLRQATRCRIQIQYSGRPATVSYPDAEGTKKRKPPFLEVISAQ